MHTTNYRNTFIQKADDCPQTQGTEPPKKAGEASVATLQFGMVHENPYAYTSDDVLFSIHAARTRIPEKEMAEKRVEFFSKGQPCFRASPLTKRWGWGVHSDAEGRIALYGAGSPEYKRLAEDQTVKQVSAMRNKRK